MNLYELNDIYQEALADAIDDNGEVLSDVLVELLNEISEAKETKVLNIACFIKNLTSEADAIKAEIDRLSARRKSLVSKAESLERYLTTALNEGEKFKDARAEITWKKSTAVEIIADLETFVGAYPNLCKVKYEPSKTLIKERIESGEIVIGAEIVTRKHLVIK